MAQIGKKINAYMELEGKPEGKRPFVRLGFHKMLRTRSTLLSGVSYKPGL